MVTSGLLGSYFGMFSGKSSPSLSSSSYFIRTDFIFRFGTLGVLDTF